MTDDFDGAAWIARPVPASHRIVRQITGDRVDLVEPGHSLGQGFATAGAVHVVSIDLVGPPDVETPELVDVRFAIVLETAAGEKVAERVFDGPFLVWDYFGPMLEVEPPAPPGDYVVVLRSERSSIGWRTADNRDAEAPDDGISPLPVVGDAFADGRTVAGVRRVGIDTFPAPNPVFRRSFELSDAPAAAQLAAVVLGTGVVSINGVRVGDEALEPAVTDYDKTVLYRSWDVAHLLRAGVNELEIAAGRERYSVRGGDVWGWHLAPWHREPVALARLVIDGADPIVTGEGWQAAAGPVEAERLFRGEDWVLRAAGSEWLPAQVVAPPAGALRRAELPPVRPGLPLPAPLVRTLDGGGEVHDFAKVMVGRIRCRVTGTAGSVVRVRSGELLAADGSVLCSNFLVAGEAQLDTLRLERDVTDYVWEPQFGYRGFRWMQIDTEGDVSVEDVRAVPLYTEVERIGELTTDQSVLEWIDDATARTFLNNLHGIPTDTPIYEKNGWTADAHLATEGLLHHFDLRSAFGKWIDDHIDAQSPDGAIPWIVPTPGWGRASDPTWSSSAVLIPWYLYREYGDRRLLERVAPMARRFADDVVGRLDFGLWRGRTWGDWLAPGYMVPPEGMAPIGTIMTVTLLQHTAAILRELGDPGAESYAAAAERVGEAYHNAYFDASAGVYAVPGVSYRQALNILPLAFGIVPDSHVASVRAGLVADLEQRTAGHLDCGAIGIRHLLPVLSAAGRDDLAITVLTRPDRPGWGAWYRDGESTLLESWDVDARSHNHYFLGSVSAWIQQRVGGLRLTEPGWRRFEIAPVDDPRVARASIRHRTPLGEAAVTWQRGAGGWRFEVTVPTGATAQVRVPTGDRTLPPGHHVVHFPGGSHAL
jgi:alpha-L-rhamnosidase